MDLTMIHPTEEGKQNPTEERERGRKKNRMIFISKVDNVCRTYLQIVTKKK